MYLGNDEIFECYIGTDAITEAYLGEELVFSSGPFSGLKLSPREMTFRSTTADTGTTAKLYVKSSEDWTLTTAADWFSLSPSTGVGNSEKTEITLTITSVPSAETTNVISCTTTSFSASSEVIFKTSYGIPANEIWYATYDGSSRITSLNNWQVYNKNGTRMKNNVCDFSTYGKLVFNSDIGYVAGDMSAVNNGWNQLTELGLPAMEPSMCIAANDFGFRYIQSEMPYWTRVYGDYPYIDETETMAWGSNGGGTLIARGKNGALVIPEGVKEIGAYGLCKSKFSSLEFPTSFTGVTGWQDNNAFGQYCLEDMTLLASMKYKSMTAPPAYGNSFSRVNQNGTCYYPIGGTGTYPKPTNFTYQTY